MEEFLLAYLGNTEVDKIENISDEVLDFTWDGMYETDISHTIFEEKTIERDDHGFTQERNEIQQRPEAGEKEISHKTDIF